MEIQRFEGYLDNHGPIVAVLTESPGPSGLKGKQRDCKRVRRVKFEAALRAHAEVLKLKVHVQAEWMDVHARVYVQAV
jgi:hypothetical protein